MLLMSLCDGSTANRPWPEPATGATVTVKLTSGGTVTPPTNNAPVFADSTAARSVAENTAAGQNVGAVLTATDADSSDTLTYTLEGADAASFDIATVSGSGRIRTKTGVTYNHEAKSSYEVTVRASDGTDSDTIAVTITVTDVTEAPGRPAAPSVSATSGNTTSLDVSWNAPTNTGPDIDDYDLRYRQGTSGGWTNGPQNVTGTSTAIGSLTANMSYQVQVRATSDEGNSNWSQSGTGSTGTPTNNAPTFSSTTAARSVDENTAAGQSVGAVLTATDSDGDTLTYTLEGTDMASFDLATVSGSAQIQTLAALDRETKSTYTVVVKADDGNSGTDTITVTITVEDVTEPPGKPAAPSVSATSGTTNSLDVSWTTPTNTGPDIDNYDLRYKLQGTTGSWTNGPQNQTGTSASISGLDPGTEYAVQVRATSDEGDSEWSTGGRGTTNASPGVTVSETALTVTEEDTTGDTYTVVLDSEPTSSVTVEVGGTSGTDVTAAPASLTFTTTTWDTAQTVTVKGVDDADTVNDMVNLTHAATSSDSDYDGFTIDGVTVEVEDNDTAQVTGVALTPGDRVLEVRWTSVANATGYRVQWKSGGQIYSSSRQGDVSAGSTTLPVMNLTNGTEYSFRVRAHRTGANNGLWSDDAMGTPQAAGVTVSETALTVTEEDTTGDTYTVVLDSEPTSSVTVEVGGTSGTDVTAAPASLTFTTTTWDTAQTVTVKGVDDADTVNDMVTLTHAATSTDSDYDGFTIAGVDVMVEDNDTAKVTGVALTPGDEELGVAWTAVANATGYQVQWKSGGQSYNTSGRQATIGSGSTASHTISSLTNGTTYTVRMRATRTGANNGPYSDEAMDAPVAGNTPPTRRLALQDASDNSAITLSPTFVSGTTSYTASEANDVDEITVLPTVNESNATYEIQDGDGTALVDADRRPASRSAREHRQVGKVLTAGLGTIADSDGLPGTFPDDYTFQWVRVDADGVERDGHHGGDVGHLHAGGGGRGQEDQGGGELHRRRGQRGGSACERRLAVERPGGGGGGRLPDGQRLVHDADGRV